MDRNRIIRKRKCPTAHAPNAKANNFDQNDVNQQLRPSVSELQPTETVQGTNKDVNDADFIVVSHVFETDDTINDDKESRQGANDHCNAFPSTPSESLTPCSDKEESNDEESLGGNSATGSTPSPKFQFRQRIYAKDAETGMLYEGVVRRAVFGVQYQRQIKLKSAVSEEELKTMMDQDLEPTWWYYIHYLGWNVKWDRWVEENNLYESTESTKLFAKRLQEQIKSITAELRGSKGSGMSIPTAKIGLELERRIAVLEREFRFAEHRHQLLKQGKVLAQAEEDAVLSQQAIKARSKWSKANIEKEFALRQRHLQGKRAQSSAELLVLPFTLKKILVEEWEIIAQSNMLATLPAAISIRQALNMYLKSKLEVTDPLENDEQESDVVESITTTEAPVSAHEIKWQEMVDGICLFFDQALPVRLLYQTEKIQFELMDQDDGDNCTDSMSRRWSDVCGCEYLLRLFLRLPALLVGELSEAESKPILANLNDLVRYLQKHQSIIFAQSYRRLNEMEKIG